MNKIIFLILTFLTTQTFAAKTVCSITINSDNEIQSFKNNLPTNEFQFVELTQFKESNSKSWLNAACESQTQCDVLLISGHFAGSFFGSSGKNLPLRDLEKASCLDSCAGIFRKVKEVYLFGCNTLAGKEKDSRTPEEYLQVLLADGFSLGQAQQVVAFRYSPLGGSFANRMRSVFSNTPKIYGFNSKSPLGKNVSPLLNRYFKKRSQQFSNIIEANNPKSTSEFLSFFKSTSMVNASGMNYNMKPSQKLSISPVCFLDSSNEKNSRLEKLKWIETMFSKGNGLEMLMYVAEFLHYEKNRKRWNSEEKTIFTAIKENQSLKTDLLGIVNSRLPWLERSKLDILSFIKEVDWMDADEVNNRVYTILNFSMENFGINDFKKVCSMGFKYSVNPYDFKANQWNNTYFKYALMCITPDNDYPLWNKINESTSYF